MATTDLPPIETDPAPTPGSALAAARARRRLSVEEAASRADLDPDTVRALEEARVYRFETPQDAIAAVIVYANGLGISKREARELVGLPVRPRLVDAVVSARFLAALVFLGAVGAAVWFGVTSSGGAVEAAPPAATAAAPSAATTAAALPEPWQIEVVVYNGSNRPGAATRMANVVAGLAYRVGEVTDAPRRDYPQTRVYFSEGGEEIGARLAAQLGVEATALPGGDDPNRLVVIVGAR